MEESWIEKGRPALLEALNTVCDQFGQNLNAELLRRQELLDPELKEELDVLRVKAARVEELELRNLELQVKLQALLFNTTSAPESELHTNEPTITAGRRETSRAEDPTSTADSTSLDDNGDVAMWKSKYDRLKSKYTTFESKHKLLLASLRKERDHKRSWRTYAEQLEKRNQYFESLYGVASGGNSDAADGTAAHDSPELNNQPSPPLPPPPSALAADHLEQVGSPSRPQITPNASFVSEADQDQDEGDDDQQQQDPPQEVELPLLRLESPNTTTTTSKTTPNPINSEISTSSNGSSSPQRAAAAEGLPRLLHDNGDTTSTDIPAEPSSDLLVIVAERPVKKRKRNQYDMAATTTSAAATAPSKRRFKAEESGSSIVFTGTGHKFSPQASIDLDEVEHRLQTPRKVRNTIVSLGAPSFNVWNQGQQQEDNVVDVFVRPRNPSSPRRNQPQTTASRSDLAASTPLLPRSPNKHMSSSRRRQQQEPQKQQQQQWDLHRGAQSLAEDGLPMGTPENRGRKPGKENEGGVLRKMLETPRNVHPSAHKISSTRRSAMIPEPRELPFDNAGMVRESVSKQPPPQPQQQQTTTRNGLTGEVTNSSKKTNTPLQTTSRKAGATVLPTALGALRSKPIADLRTDDFRINPAYNDGYDYAWSDTVRGKDQRSKLGGCSDPQCMGEYRKQALMERSTMDPVPTAAQKKDEQILLEKYLGDAAYRLTGMSKDEREELWVEARTRQMTDSYCRHKTHYPRQRSPPGFWTSDMPSTQEEEANRREAMQREQEKVRERYREAMRPGRTGRYLFRDE